MAKRRYLLTLAGQMVELRQIDPKGRTWIWQGKLRPLTLGAFAVANKTFRAWQVCDVYYSAQDGYVIWLHAGRT